MEFIKIQDKCIRAKLISFVEYDMSLFKSTFDINIYLNCKNNNAIKLSFKTKDERDTTMEQFISFLKKR